MILDAQLTVYCGKNTLHLSHGEHTSQETVTGIITTVLVAEHTHTMVYAHRQVGIHLLEDACQLYEVSTSTQMTCLSEVAILEDMARAHVHEPCTVGILTSQLYHIVVTASR